jgi:hypothetical protein
MRISMLGQDQAVGGNVTSRAVAPISPPYRQLAGWRLEIIAVTWR